MSGRQAVAVYARVSTEEQAERQSIRIQTDAASKHVALHELAVFDTYTDDGISGTLHLEQRPEGARLLRDARAGRFGTLLVWKLDRLGREALVTLLALDVLERCGVSVVSLTEAFDLSTPEGRFTAVLLSGVAGRERQNILARSIAGMERKAREGVWQGGAPPYGYRLGPDRRLVVSESLIPGLRHSEADIMRLMFGWCATERLSTQKIADRLNGMGVPLSSQRDGAPIRPRGPKPRLGWTGGRVRNLLTSTVYRGEWRWGKNTAGNGEREPITVEVPALVSADLWRQAQEALRANMLYATRNAKQPYLLRGLMKCGICGSTYVGTTGSSSTRRYYRCHGANRPNATLGMGQKCTSKPVNADEVEAEIWADVDYWLHHPGEVVERLAARLREEMARADELHRDLLAVRGQLAGMARERDSILTLFRKGRISEADLDRQLDQVQVEQRALEEQVAGLTERLRAADTEQQRLHSVEGLLATLRQKAEGPLDDETKREIVERLVADIRVDTVEENGQREAEVHITYVFGAPEHGTATQAASPWC